MHTSILVIAVITAAAIFLVAILLFLHHRSKRLRQQFGPEYSRTIAETGDRWKAESVLEHRQKRVKALHIRAVDPAGRERFLGTWRSIQARFVDDPNGTLVEADRLVGSVLSAQGYPSADFEQRSEDISVDHPAVVEHYRDVHSIALKHDQGCASTEDLRQAMVHYRILFEDLIGQPEYTQTGRAL